jgi:hypothetical protein
MPVIALLATFLIALVALIGAGLGGRRAFLYAATWLGVAIVCLTELLGAGRFLSRPALAASWGAIAIGGAWVARTKVRAGVLRSREWITAAPGAWRTLDWLERVGLAGAAAVVLFIAVVAVVCPPNTQDVLEYHLPRVMMWIGNRSVSFYPTPNYAQLVHAPFAEFAMLHLDLLWGSDRLVNLVQTFSFVACAVAASSIAARLGALRRGQVLAAVACVSIPEGTLEASGAMNTAVVSMWIAAGVVALLASRDGQTWLDALTAGAAMGLAVLSKGIAFAVAPPMVVALLLMLPRARRTNLLARAPLLVALAVAINLPQALRDRDLTGSWLGAPFPDAGPVMGFAVEDPSPSQLLANSLRNVSLNLPLRGSSERIEAATRAAIRRLGQDPDDPRSIFMGTQYGVVGRFSVPPFAHNEIKTGNFVPLVLTLAAIVWAFATRRRGGASREAMVYAAGLVCAFLFFSATLRWQVWGARFQLPLFVLSAALIGPFLQAWRRSPQTLAVAVLLLGGLAFTLRNDVRSLLPRALTKGIDVYRPRAELYFSDEHRDAMEGQMALAGMINRTSCQTLAFDSYNPKPDATLTEGPPSFFVYPLMALTGVDGGRRRAWYQGVHNLSSKYEAANLHPHACAVVCLSCAGVADRLQAYREYPGVQAVGADLLFSEQRL